ncbi:protein FAM47E isoform X1 [Dendropsophus ebraccatus]|uniref:protein FAM47E isoform X1 n=1 Tax=Dendropsophus ebraccatus TaxID=150705 RepID=UPI0038317BB8
MSAVTGLGSDSQPPRYPWYKERLHKKFLKESNHKLHLSGALNTHQWKFLPKGVDDFRDGYPTATDTPHVTAGKRHALFLQNVADDPKPTQKHINRFSKEQVYFSKLIPQQQARREYIAGIEYGLAQHPLALYPHLEEGVPPDIFEEIVGILDPEMRLKSASGFYEIIPEDQEEENILIPAEQQEVQSVKSREASTRQSSIRSEQSRLKNPYKWLSKQEPAPEEKKSKTTRPFTPAHDESVKQVTKEFCDWVTSLGGEKCNINESAIFSLFASGYETKPALSVPIHVVELNNVPPELRVSVGVSQEGESKISATRNAQKSKESTYCPSWVKTRYGAWYLDPKTWIRQKVNEPLKDPALEKKEKGAHSTEKLSQKDEELLQLHGTIAFKDFIEKRGHRKPEFLNKLFSEKEGVTSDSAMAAESRATSSAKNTWYRSSSASTHEDSIIN